MSHPVATVVTVPDPSTWMATATMTPSPGHSPVQDLVQPEGTVPPLPLSTLMMHELVRHPALEEAPSVPATTCAGVAAPLGPGLPSSEPPLSEEPPAPPDPGSTMESASPAEPPSPQMASPPLPGMRVPPLALPPAPPFPPSQSG